VRESIKKRMEHSYNTKDRGGGRPQAFNWNEIEDAKFYTPKEKKNKICVISYNVATKNDPMVYSKDYEIGSESYMLDIQLHMYIGPQKADIICLNQFGKKCPICDKANEFKDSGDKKSAGKLWPSRFCYYNIIDMENTEDGIQILGIKYNKFEKLLITAGRAASDDDGIFDFSDNAHPTIISFWGEMVTKNIDGNNATYLEFSNFNFKKAEKLDKVIIKQAKSFDKYLKMITPDEAEKTLFGDEDESDSDSESEEDEKPKSKKKVVEDDDENEKPKAKGKTKGHPVDDDDEEDSDDESEDDDEEESEDEDEESDEDEDEEDDEPAPKAKAKPVAKKTVVGKPVTVFKCPKKHVFGKDCDKFPKDCEECDLWADCAKEQKKLKANKTKDVF